MLLKEKLFRYMRILIKPIVGDIADIIEIQRSPSSEIILFALGDKKIYMRYVINKLNNDALENRILRTMNLNEKYDMSVKLLYEYVHRGGKSNIIQIETNDGGIDIFGNINTDINKLPNVDKWFETYEDGTYGGVLIYLGVYNVVYKQEDRILKLVVDEAGINNLITEAKCLLLVKDIPNVMKIKSIIAFNGKYIGFSADFINGCLLSNKMLHASDAVKISWCMKMTNALKEIHNKGVIHCDIKPTNIMISTDDDVHIIDFGFSIITDVEEFEIIRPNNELYLAPELIHNYKPTIKSDIYALGLTFWYMFSNIHIAESYKDNKYLAHINIKKIKECVNKCCDENPEKRPTLNEISNILIEN